MFISYAQNFEDVMLWRALKNVENGFYIDIGAQDPVVDSVSLAFYEHGWRGVHVEPVPYYADKIRQARPDETVIQAAVGHGNTVRRFFEIVDTGLSTGDEHIAQKHRADGLTIHETIIPCLPLCEILDYYRNREIHWLKIDVEGMEEEVLRSWQPSAVRPWIVVIESTLPNTQLETHKKWESLIKDVGYDFVYFDGLNRFYVHQSHQELKAHFNSPPNVFDGFVLSGTSGSFCSLLNDKFSRMENELTKQLETSRQEIHRLEVALAERENEAGELQVMLGHAGERILQLAQRENDLKAQLESSRQEINRLEQALAEREREKAELLSIQERVKEETMESFRGTLLQYENEIKSAKMKIDELNGHANHWWTVADGLNRELHGVYTSWSWRLTSPLRLVNHYRRKFSRILKVMLFAFILRLPRRIIRRCLEWGLAYVRRHPAQKGRLKALLARCPRLQTRLNAFAMSRHTSSMVTVSFPAPVSLPDDSIDLRDYPVSVRTFYRQLLACRSQSYHKGENA